MIIMSWCSCILTTFEKELQSDTDEKIIQSPLVQALTTKIETLVAARLDAHTSNIILLLNNIK